MPPDDLCPPTILEAPGPGGLQPRRRLEPSAISPAEPLHEDDEEEKAAAQQFKQRKARLRNSQGLFERTCRNALDRMTPIRDRRFSQRIANRAGIDPIVVVCMSDTHNLQVPDVPNGDILIHSGDLTDRGTVEELKAALAWLDSLPHPHKFFIAGNHDTCLSEITYSSIQAEFPTLTYLQDSSATFFVRGRKVGLIGSPWTPGNWAFQYPRGTKPSDSPISWIQQEASSASFEDGKAEKFNLVTHGPPKGHLDETTFGLLSAGCETWPQVLWSLSRKPDFHVFGHIHDSPGMKTIKWDFFQRLCDGLPPHPGLLTNRHALSDLRWIWLFTIIALAFICWLVMELIPFKFGANITLVANASSLNEVRKGIGRIERRVRSPLVARI